MKFTDQQVEQVLLQLTTPDTRLVKEAEEQVKLLMKTPVCITAFLNQIMGSSHTAARQLAAILLRKKIGPSWKKLAADHKQSIKTVLLQRLASEPEKPVQMAIAGVVAVVAKISVPVGKWDELLQFLHQCSQQPEARFRELAMRLFRVLSDTIGSRLVQHFDTLFALFVNGLNDPQSLVVKEEAIRALGAVFVNVETEEQYVKFGLLIPHICQVIEASVACGHETAAAYGFELLDDFAECPIPIMDEHIGSLVPFASKIMLMDSVPMNVREGACSMITFIVKYQPKKLLQNNLVLQVLESCFFLLAVSCQTEEEEEENAQALALELLDEILINMPNEVVYDPAIKGALHLVQSQDAAHRRAGQLLLFVMAEGCAEPMKKHLVDLLQITCNGMQDPDQKVRANACSALAQLSEHLQPEIYEHHQAVISHILTRLDDANESLEVKQRLVSTIDSYFQELPEEVSVKYLNDVMGRFDALIRIPDRKLQQAVIQSIGTVASSAKKNFVPFFEHFMGLMIQLMNLHAEEDHPLRAQATRSCGNIATAVGREIFTPVLQQVLSLSLEGFKLDSCEIRESTYFFYSYMAEVFGVDFMGFIPQIIENVFTSLSSQDGLSLDRIESDNNEAFGSCGDGFDSEGEEEEEDGEDEDGRVRYSIMNSYIDEKLGALQAISAFLKHLGPNFFDFIPKICEILEDLTVYVHESVRILSLLAFEEVMRFLALYFQLPAWQQGVVQPLDPRLDEYVGKIFPMLVSSAGIEFDKQVASVAVDTLARCIKILGPIALEECAGIVVQTVLMILNDEHPSQKFAVEEATASNEDLDELLESAGDLVSSMAKVGGPLFAEAFREICGTMVVAARSTNHAGKLASIMGCLGEVTAELDSNVVEFAQELMPLMHIGLTHESSIVRRSAVYCIGSMYASGGESLRPFYNETLARIEPLFHIPGDADYNLQAAKDNATSALAKMIHADATGLPLVQLIPVLLQNLPLNADYLENKFVFPALIFLLANQPDVIAPHISTVFTLFANGLGSEEVDDDTKQEIAVCMRNLVGAHPQMKPIIEQLPGDVSAMLLRHIQ
eukprot:TRINITY_DN6955_c0_g1_i1.p1 TRINITY_DN6955_c0_g1~~TRINITY_DN6955_c0_g1_i1.p1  ORF type:complete len:1069 (+),score=347.26 TRINITY_DN6955_c0_g1_i1:122-3328(+)